MSKVGTSALFPVCVEKKAKSAIGLSYKEQRWGYINDKGEIVIEPTFGRPVAEFSEGLAPVCLTLPMRPWDTLYKWKWGYIDTTGTTVIKPAFELANLFSEGLAAVVIRRILTGSKVGFIDKKGDIVVDPKYRKAASFSEGMASVTCCDFWRHDAYIDKTGSMVIERKFDFCGDFSEGLARVSSRKCSGYIDRTGNLVIELKRGLGTISYYESIPERLARASFSEGLACTDAGRYIDKTGDIVIAVDPTVSWSGKFSEGMACVAIGDKYGYIDKSGKIVIEPQFGKVQAFSEGLAAVRTMGKRPRWGYIDREGNMVIEPQLWDADRFTHGLAFVRTDTGHGYIDNSGKYVWEPTFPFPDLS